MVCILTCVLVSLIRNNLVPTHLPLLLQSLILLLDFGLHYPPQVEVKELLVRRQQLISSRSVDQLQPINFHYIFII